MEEGYQIFYHPKVISDDISKLSSLNKKIIKKSIEQKLQTSPLVFGIPLRSSLKGMRKLRVGDYRVIFLIQKKTVRILLIEHRSSVYDSALKRI